MAEGNLNTAKYAIASTFDVTLTERHTKAMTNAEIADFARDLDIALFYPTVLREHEILDRVKVNDKISVLELIEIFEEHRSSIIINLKYLQKTYHRKGVNRIRGSRDENGNFVQPWLTTEYSDNSEYVGMGSFEINRNTASINMLVTRRVKLVKAEDKTPITEVAGLLVSDLNTYNNYSFVSDGELNVKSLKVKISSKKTFDLLNATGVLQLNNSPAEKFDFRAEYTIELDRLPLATFDKSYSSIDGLFEQLAAIKVLSSIISAHLKGESETFLPEQLEELKKHYLSKSLYLNFPTTTEYTDLKQALANGTVDSRVSYKIDIGNQEILNLSKLPSANKFLDKMYEAYNREGEIFEKPTFELALDENIIFRHKQLSSRTKITKVDELMKPIFDDFFGITSKGIVRDILSKVDADNLIRLLQDKWHDRPVSRQETIAALTVANAILENYAEKIYRDKICPLVFYIGSTGLLPDEMDAKATTAEELAAKYGNLQFSRDEQEGTFFEVGNSIVSVYAKNEYYSIKPTVAVED